jgi:hypothetical protein
LPGLDTLSYIIDVYVGISLDNTPVIVLEVLKGRPACGVPYAGHQVSRGLGSEITDEKDQVDPISRWN